MYGQLSVGNSKIFSHICGRFKKNYEQFSRKFARNKIQEEIGSGNRLYYKLPACRSKEEVL